MIPVTKPFLPPKAAYDVYLEGIWQRNWLTNNGPLVKELELKLMDYLAVKNLLFLSNGTMAIQIAIKALKLTGEVITTPFSYIATTSSLVWEGCKPIFVDIDEDTLNIDSGKIESAITPRTQAILATHCYGNPCDIDSIQSIASKYNLKVIYDAAHCFGTKYDGRSVYAYGNISTASFHATKLYHSVEGGAVITNDHDLLSEMRFMRNFGHDGFENFHGVGINGKNSELHAAFGIVNLKYVDEILENRNILSQCYDRCLKFTGYRKPLHDMKARVNFSYYPLVFDSEQRLLVVLENLNKQKVYPRRYFFPSLNTLHYLDKRKMPLAEDISRRVVCLPLYYGLLESELEMIAEIINSTSN